MPALAILHPLGKRSVEDYKQEEYKVWFDGSAEGIEEFYKYVQHPYRIRTQGFWAAVNTDMVRVHSGYHQQLVMLLDLYYSRELLSLR